MFCHKCGNENDTEAKFCKKCGAPLYSVPKDPVSDQKKKRNYTAFIIVFVVALLGCVVGVFLAVAEMGQKNDTDANENTKIQTETGDEEIKKTDTENNYDVATENLINKLRAAQGTANGEFFITCDMSTLHDFPAESGGFLNYVRKDIEGDGTDEIFATYLDTEDHTLYLKVYKYRQQEFQLALEKPVAVIDAFSDMELYLFNNTQLGSWQILYTNQTVGSYTGADAFSVQLFTVNTDISLYKSWNWDSLEASQEVAYEYVSEMQQEGIPYTNLGRFEYGQRGENISMLAKAKVSVHGDIPSLYTVQMCVFNEEMYAQDQKFIEIFLNEDKKNIFERLAFTGIAFQNTDELENVLDNYLLNEFSTFRSNEYQWDSQGYVMVPKADVLDYINSTFGLNIEEFTIDKNGLLGEYFADGYYHIGGASGGDIRIFTFAEYECISKSQYMVRVDAAYEDGTTDASYYFSIEPADTKNGFIVKSLSVY